MSGDNGAAEQVSDARSPLERAIQAELDAVGAGETLDPQTKEVATAFLCRARNLAREGKDALAKRQCRAARNVLAGGKGDGEDGLEGEDGAR